MMIINRLLLFVCTLIVGTSVIAQPTSKQRRERLRMVKRVSKTKNPYIRLNDKREISVDELLNLSDSIQWILSYKSGSKEAIQYGKRGINGVIDVRTVHYRDSLEMFYRRNAMKDYKKNEMNCFFGNKDPLILFGDKEISRKEFCELPEDTVAFVNFYLTDFVKEYYAPKGRNGIVYVCPRRNRSAIKYTNFLPQPANGRNYMDEVGHMFSSFKAVGDSISCFKYIQRKVKDYEDEYDKNIQATVVVSCVINTDGIIKPIIVERIDSKQDLTIEQQRVLIRISEDIILSMPPWDPGVGFLFDIDHNQYIADPRETSRSISIGFGLQNSRK